jgi:hypothetical protein
MNSKQHTNGDYNHQNRWQIHTSFQKEKRNSQMQDQS